MLRIVEVIGQDKLDRIDEDTIYFIIRTLNELNIDQIRNKILLKVLPLKVKNYIKINIWRLKLYWQNLKILRQVSKPVEKVGMKKKINGWYVGNNVCSKWNWT